MDKIQILNVRPFGCSLGVIFGLMIIHFLSGCSAKTSDDFCDHGYGQTFLKGRVLDFYTKKPIDSVEINISYGMSWEIFSDTVVKQTDSLLFTFNAPDDCEPYVVTLFNKHYWSDPENYLGYRVSINKGTINNFEFSLKPATFFKVNVWRDTLNNTPDTVLLQVKKTNSKVWENWREIFADDFRAKYLNNIPPTYNAFLDSGTHRTISVYYDIESNVDYDVRWTRRNTRYLDTLEYHFRAEPFDTVQLDYRFKKY